MKKAGFLLVMLYVIPQQVFAGFDLGTTGNGIFWVALLAWSAFVAALLLERKSQLSAFGAGIISAFIPRNTRVVHMPHITVSEAPITTPKIAPVLQSNPQAKAETDVSSPVVQSTTSVSRPSKRVYGAALAKSLAKNSLAGKKILSRSRGLIATQARDAVTIYKNIWRDLWHFSSKKSHAPTLELKKIDAVLANSHIVTSKIKAAHIESPVEKKEPEAQSHEVMAQEVHTIPIEQEVSTDEHETISPIEESHVVPEVATKIALVEDVQPKMPVIEFVPAPEVKDHERSREQALMRAQRAILRARNAQEGLEVVPTGALAMPKRIHEAASFSTAVSHATETDSFTDDLDSSQISEELKNFKARVAEVESRNRTAVHPKTVTPRNNEEVHHQQTIAKTKGQSLAPDATHRTKDVVTLDVSSGTPKLVLTRHNL
ncbi:MAG: hypothetical protein WAX38_00430 [Minisyncoccia bacterium]